MDYYTDAAHMARVLTSYISCNRKVQREVDATFGQRIHLSTIARIRASNNRPIVNAPRDFDRSVTQSDERYSDAMSEANDEFISALMGAKAA
jgi:hypothetical protein